MVIYHIMLAFADFGCTLCILVVVVRTNQIVLQTTYSGVCRFNEFYAGCSKPRSPGTEEIKGTRNDFPGAGTRSVEEPWMEEFL